MYSYNSYHKIVIGLLIVVWAVYQFSGRSTESKRFDNGQVKATGSQKNSLNEGTWTWYYPNGQIELRGSFHEGKREGSWNRYDSLGNLMTSSQYVANRIHGLHIEYAPDGSVIEEHEYRNDTLIKKVKLL